MKSQNWNCISINHSPTSSITRLILVIIFFAFGIYSHQASGSILHYEVKVGFIGSGRLSVERIFHGINDYSLKIEGDVKIPFKKIRYYTLSRFVESRLSNSDVTKHINDELKDKTTVRLQQSVYHIQIDDKKSQLKDEVSYTVAQLYYREPKGIEQIFSEKFGAFCPMISKSQGVYELRLPDGIRSEYHYAHGICTYVRTRLMGQTVEFKLSS
jgi:hypothetical protein